MPPPDAATRYTGTSAQPCGAQGRPADQSRKARTSDGRAAGAVTEGPPLASRHSRTAWLSFHVLKPAAAMRAAVASGTRQRRPRYTPALPKNTVLAAAT